MESQAHATDAGDILPLSSEKVMTSNHRSWTAPGSPGAKKGDQPWASGQDFMSVTFQMFATNLWDM